MGDAAHDRRNSPEVLEYRINTLEGSVTEIKQAVKSIDASLQILARLEQRHAETRDGLERAFKEIEDHETRVRIIEGEMPTIKLTRGWLVSGVVSVIGVVGLAVVMLVVK